MSPARAASMTPKLRRTLVTVFAMTATIMQALDTTIANVALPYMQGSLSASLDQRSAPGSPIITPGIGCS
jgi:DHA2 family multidrug resistance protein